MITKLTRGQSVLRKDTQASPPATTGSLLGRGFDDVQIQRVGDGILISFRLQPATTARVEQKTNRIEIVFSIPMRSQAPAPNAARSEEGNPNRTNTIGNSVEPTAPVSRREEPWAEEQRSTSLPSPSPSAVRLTVLHRLLLPLRRLLWRRLLASCRSRRTGNSAGVDRGAQHQFPSAEDRAAGRVISL
jgi:hypothetical protein